MELSQYRLETLHQDGEFIRYRGLRQTRAETIPQSILALSPLMERPTPSTIKKLEHEFSLKDDLDPAWAVGPIALTQQQSRTMLLFEDPEGEPLERLVRGSMELNRFFGCDWRRGRSKSTNIASKSPIPPSRISSSPICHCRGSPIVIVEVRQLATPFTNLLRSRVSIFNNLRVAA